ncbi:MAG: energy transducer TonB [Terracidiphilus sp.]
MKCAQGMKLVAALVWLGTGIAGAQQAPPTAAAPLAEAATPPAKVYDVQPDVVGPELLPVKWEVMAADACREAREGLVSLTLVVDAEGVPRDVAVESPQGTTLEKMALRIVERDRFKPGTSKSEPVAVKRTAELSIKGCFATKTDEAGNTTDVFRLTAQPEQRFDAPALPTVPVSMLAAGAGDPPSPGLFRIGHGVSAPVALNSVVAQYSEEARFQKIEGVCLVSVIVDAQGKLLNPRVVRALGYGLDAKAIEAVKKYKFKPAMKDGITPVPVMITVAVNFRLYQ